MYGEYDFFVGSLDDSMAIRDSIHSVIGDSTTQARRRCSQTQIESTGRFDFELNKKDMNSLSGLLGYDARIEPREKWPRLGSYDAT